MASTSSAGNKLIVITGGSSGIGKASAKLLYQAGHRIILIARNEDKLAAAAREMSDNDDVFWYSADLSKPDSASQCAVAITQEHGLPDVIISCAGAGEWLSMNESSMDHYKATIESPYLATAYTCKAFYDLMKDRGTGHFIIVNSAATYFKFKGAVGYLSARWAMMGFTKAMQADLYDSKFVVSMVALGKVDTSYFTSNPISENKIPKLGTMFVPTLTEAAAGAIVAHSVKSRKQHIIRPRVLGFFIFLNRIFPRIFSSLMRAAG